MGGVFAWGGGLVTVKCLAGLLGKGANGEKKIYKTTKTKQKKKITPNMQGKEERKILFFVTKSDTAVTS